MARKKRDPTPVDGEVRRAFIGIYLPPDGTFEQRLVCSVCLELTTPSAKRMAALTHDHNFCEGCGVRLVP